MIYQLKVSELCALAESQQLRCYFYIKEMSLSPRVSTIVEVDSPFEKKSISINCLPQQSSSQAEIDSYNKSEDDALLLLKANVADLTNYVDLTSVQTISGQKQFGVISVSNISKLSKNDASILLAGGGDMLVSSLVTQPQLYEIIDIDTEKSKAYVFSIQEEMNDWMTIQDNVAKLVIGDNLYIDDKEVTDYWWDGTNLRVLETELPDMSNVISTLRAATGGGNAIIDISIDGNTLILARNTIYDNSSVFLVGEGVKSISDINATVDLSNYYNKTQIYFYSEIYSLLKNKSNIGVSYSKSESYAIDDVCTKFVDDAFQLLKVDMKQLISAYTKTETNNLLNNKTNTGVSYCKSETYTRDEVYTKGQDDTLLLAKADKTQLFDSYSKNETYVRDEVQIKTEIDQLISDIDVGDIDLTVYYNKTKTDELLDEKLGTTDLVNYVTLGTSQIITTNKIFNNACRFASSIDGMSTVIGSSFIKSGADNIVVLLGTGGIQPISKTEIDNKYVRLEGSVQQTITGRLKYVSSFGGTYDETQDPVENTYLTQSEVDVKLTNYVNISINQEINDTKTFNANINITGFVKTDKDDTSVLLVDGGTSLLSSLYFNINFGSHYWKCKQFHNSFSFSKHYKSYFIGNEAKDINSVGGIKFYKLRNKVVYNIELHLREDFMGFVFTCFPEKLWPFNKHSLELGDDGDYEPLKSATSDVNGDEKFNIVDDWHVNSTIDGIKSML
ncbi:MAG: hypothetical protein EZS28_005839 [Streblomastix strix]|uniref:Uncharacterized protein n=1 Tax=Streblomastix strix TaxID=222440 RepID=A0A5J4WUC7_9EUKA|nr:MAG: hypothetical protein EZS28_005839 [Streblomastix strix]